MDLFTPVVSEDKWHPNFSAIMKARNGYNCDVINDWSKGFVDRDRKFVKEFQTSFNSSFWELYLNAVFNFYGFSMDWTHPSPDFYIMKPIDFIVEATIASNEDIGDPEFLTFESLIPDDLNEFNRKTIIRLSNSIHAKFIKYKESYSLLSHVSGKPFIIAVTAFDQPYFSMTCQRAIEALLFGYYVDEEEYIAREDNSEPLVGGHVDKVLKDNNSQIELGLFSKGIMPEISAVLFSSTATWGKVRALSHDPNPYIKFDALRYNPHSVNPHKIELVKQNYRETLLDGLRIYHNPFAQFPIDPCHFRNKDVFQVYPNYDTGEFEYDIREGQLLFRKVYTYVDSLSP